MPKTKTPFPQRPPIVVSAPLLVRRDLAPEMQSLLEVITGQVGEDVAASGRDRLTTIAEEHQSRLNPSENRPGTLNESGTSFFSCGLRSSFSYPDLRPSIPPSERFPIRSRSPQPSRPRSAFSLGTQFVREKRPTLRRMLDAGGCTKGEKFDIRDFARVRPSRSENHPTVTPAAVLETSSTALRQERWRDGVQQMLYPGVPLPPSEPRDMLQVEGTNGAIGQAPIRGQCQ